MRPDHLYLDDVVEAVDAIERFLDGIDKPAFMRSELHQSAVLQKLTLIGEAVSRISRDLRSRYPDVPWRDIVGFRNIAVHEYFVVDWSIVWFAATKNAPALRAQIAAILPAEVEEWATLEEETGKP